MEFGDTADWKCWKSALQPGKTEALPFGTCFFVGLEGFGLEVLTGAWGLLFGSGRVVFAS